MSNALSLPGKSSRLDIVNQLRHAGWSKSHIETALVDGRPLANMDVPKWAAVISPVVNGRIGIIVFGPPVSKPRMTQQDKWKVGDKARPGVKKYRNWCDCVRPVVAGKLPNPSEIQELNWRAYFEPAQTWPKKKKLAAIGQLHRQKPDVDNIYKAILDCLFVEDSAIAAGTVKKLWDWKPRVEIEIVMIPDYKETTHAQ